MTVAPLLKAMHRMPWRDVASKAIHLSGGRPRKGWRNTMAAAEEHGDLNGANLGELERLYKEHLLVGEKFTKLYALDQRICEGLREAATKIVVQASPYTSHYPLPLPEADLAAADDEIHLVDVIRSDDGVGLVYCSRLVITKREELIVRDWVDNQKNCEEILSQFTEIYGLKVERTQLFHVIWISGEINILDIRVDYPDGMHDDIAHRIHSKIRKDFEASSGIKIPSNPIDLMPAIASIYHNKDEGNVVELSFVTITNSVKNEKMRQARGGYQCLRSELYHVAGTDALKQGIAADSEEEAITPFRISVQWPLHASESVYISPELTLASTTRGDGKGKITGVSIRNCLETSQYLFIRDKLLKHLNIYR